MPQMPWICGDTTMLEQIERKRTLCMEIRSRQHPHLQRSLERPPPTDRNEDRQQERNQCKQDNPSVLPNWGKGSGPKKIRPPPYPTQTTVFWDTAIWHWWHTPPCHMPQLPTPLFRCVGLIFSCNFRDVRTAAKSRGIIVADVKDNGGYHSNISTISGCHVFLSSLVIFDIFLFPVIGFL